MINKLICSLLGHKAGGRKVECPFTLYTYIHCKRCDKTYEAYPTCPDFIENPQE